jgi:predicted dehydrogenase
MKTNQSRRKFIATAVSGTVASVVAPMAFAKEQGTEQAVVKPTILSKEVFGANDRIRIAILGVNSRGGDHMASLSRQEDNITVATLCDPDMNVLKERAKQWEERYKQKYAIEQDFRKVLEDKNIDAVTVASPNHWHTLHAIYACQAGKDVYVEKPATHNVAEGRKLIEAAYKYDRIVQHGVQLRSSIAIREAVQHLRDGLIGRVYMARGLVFRSRPDIGDKGISKVPEGLDYDLWCGPAPMAPFTQNLVHYNWHWHWNYGNGDVANQGVHETDLCMWGLDVGLPERITSMGGKFLWDDCKEVPEVLTSIYHYPKQKKIIQFEVRPWYTNREDGADVGNIFYGDKGYLVVKNYGTYESYLGPRREPGPARTERGELELHFKNWLDAIRARDKTIQNGPVESGHLASALAHLGNISYRLGRQLDFDPVSESCIGDEDANRMLTRKYRAPYLMPEKI